jgi:hypothetical protein
MFCLHESTTCRNPSLGLTTKAKSCTGVGQEECERVWGWKLTLLNELPFWELESRWTPEPSESDRKSQNTSHWKVLYIIRKLLKCICLKCTCMTHLDIYNTSYGKKKNRESNYHEMTGIDPNSVRAGGVQHTVGKLLTRATTLLQTSSKLEV